MKAEEDMTVVKQSPVQRYIHKIADPDGSRHLDDQELLGRFVRGKDQSAFAVLVARHGPGVLGVCRRILGGSPEAEDAFQAVFLVLVRKAESLARQDLLGPWLYGVAVRTALKARSKEWKRRLQQRPLTDLEQPTLDPTAQELRHLLDEELNRLSPRHRQPILLCYLEGKTTEEAGKILGCSKGTILSRLARGRDKLRHRLLRRGFTVSAAAVAGLIPEIAMAAPVSTESVVATARTAYAFAFGKSAGAAAVSVQVAGLTKGVLTSMFICKLKTIAALLILVTGIVAAGWAVHASAGQAGPRTPAAVASAPLVVAMTDDEAELRALIDKAIQSAGGQTKLGKFTAGTCTIKGKAEDGHTFAVNGFLQGDEQFKLDGQFERNGIQENLTMVLNRDQAWMKSGDRIKEAPKEILQTLRDLARTFRYVHALTPLKDRGVSLQPLGEVNVEGTPALGMKVICQGQKDLHIFLDKATARPLKAELRITERNGQEKVLEFALSDHKEFEGRKHFTKVSLKEEGNLVFEGEFSDFRWLDKLEAGTFDRP